MPSITWETCMLGFWNSSSFHLVARQWVGPWIVRLFQRNSLPPINFWIYSENLNTFPLWPLVWLQSKALLLVQCFTNTISSFKYFSRNSLLQFRINSQIYFEEKYKNINCFNPCPAEPEYPYFFKHCRSRWLPDQNLYGLSFKLWLLPLFTLIRLVDIC